MHQVTDRKIALVTGASRGIGLDVCRQLAEKGLHVILSARSEKAGRAAAESLTSGKTLSVEFQPLDVTHPASIELAKKTISEKFGRLDVLVNNAGVLEDSGPALAAKIEDVRETMATNAYGPLLLCQAFIPMMKQGGYGRVVNVSSGMGQLSDMSGGYLAYRLSKTALNAVTRIFAAEAGDGDVLVNSACPGWVRTDMGGAGAPRTVEQGADTIVWLATLPKGGPTGGFFRDREPIDW